MTLRTYRGKSVDEVLTRVHGELGADAVILHTKMDTAGGIMGLGARRVIEVTAMAKGGRGAIKEERKEVAAARSRKEAMERTLRAAQRTREQVQFKVEKEPTNPLSKRVQRSTMNYSDMLQQAAEAIASEQGAQLGVELTMAVEVQRRRQGETARMEEIFQGAWREVMMRREEGAQKTRGAQQESGEDRSLTAVYGENAEIRDALIARVITRRARMERGGALVLDSVEGERESEVRTYAEALGATWRRLGAGQELSEVISETSSSAAVIVRLGSATEIHRNPVKRLLELWEDARLGVRCIGAVESDGERGVVTLGLKPLRTAHCISIGLEERLGLDVVMKGTRTAWERMRPIGS